VNEEDWAGVQGRIYDSTGACSSAILYNIRHFTQNVMYTNPALSGGERFKTLSGILDTHVRVQ
jgi:hypothetical protein